jgi:hypothetical protein
MLKDSVPCPIPNGEKDAQRRSFFVSDFTDAGFPFNRDRPFLIPAPPLCPKPVAQMTRFRPGSSPLGNHARRVRRQSPGRQIG